MTTRNPSFASDELLERLDGLLADCVRSRRGARAVRGDATVDAPRRHRSKTKKHKKNKKGKGKKKSKARTTEGSGLTQVCSYRHERDEEVTMALFGRKHPAHARGTTRAATRRCPSPRRTS